MLVKAQCKLGHLSDLDVVVTKITLDGWGKSWQKLVCHLDQQV